MNPDGSDQHEIASFQPMTTLGVFWAFSPDGCSFAASDALQGIVFDIQTGAKVVIDEGDPGSYDQVTNFAWSPDSNTLTYYRGTEPDQPGAVRELRQVTRLADGSWGTPKVIPLDPSGEAMLPRWQLADGRLLTQMYGPGPGFYGVSNITDLSTGKTLPLTYPTFKHPPDVSDISPDGRIVFGERTGAYKPWNPNTYIGRISASGAITDVVTLAPPPEVLAGGGKFTPDQTGVLVGVIISTPGPRVNNTVYTFGFGLFSLLDDGTTRYTTIMGAQPGIRGNSSLGSQYAVVSVANSDNGSAPAEIWLVAMDGSVAVPLTDGYLPVGLPICEK